MAPLSKSINQILPSLSRKILCAFRSGDRHRPDEIVPIPAQFVAMFHEAGLTFQQLHQIFRIGIRSIRISA